jgi:hypothetical protein
MVEPFQYPETPRVPQQCPIILVHGTWGRGFFANDSVKEMSKYSARGRKRWFEDGSEFRQALQLALHHEPVEYSIRTLLWSGGNSVHARDAAAVSLAAELEKDLERPGVAPVVIAHSHGGNVALRAFQYLKSDPSRIRVITLATPFLRVFARESVDLSFTIWILIWGAIFGVVFTSVTALILFASTTAAGLASPTSIYALLLVDLVGAALVSVLLVRQLIAVFVNPRSGPENTRSRAVNVQQAAFYPSVDASGPPILIIRGVDDEASLALAAGSIGSRLSSLFLLSVIPTLYGVGLSLIFLLVVLLNLDEQRGQLLELMVAIAGSLGAFVFLMLPGMFKSTFGKEFLTTAFVCEIAADSAPDARGSVDAVTLSPSKPPASWQLRHGIYSHPECVNEIVRWLRKTR